MNCPACDCKPGEHHEPGCWNEYCSRCACQQIGCDCVYEVNGFDMQTIDWDDHPDLYHHGPTPEMWAKFDAEWADRREVWCGEHRFAETCRKFDFWTYWNENEQRYIQVAATHPQATLDYSRLWKACRWNADEQRWERF